MLLLYRYRKLVKLAPDRESKIQAGVMPGLVPELLLAEALVRAVTMLCVGEFWLRRSGSCMRSRGLSDADPSMRGGSHG